VTDSRPDAQGRERIVQAGGDLALSALVAEAAAKSSLLWVAPTPERAWPAWHIWLDGAAYVVSGPGEQELPPLAGEVEVTLRSKDTWARVLRVTATATTVDPAAPEWRDVALALKGSRLNAPDPDGLLDRWAAGNTITRLSLRGAVNESPGHYDESSGAAAPPPSEAATRDWAPWHVGGRRKTRRNARRIARRDQA
jgi:hypothetical protein